MYQHQFNKHVFTSYENSKLINKLGYNRRVIAYYSETYFANRINAIEKATEYLKSLYANPSNKRSEAMEQKRIIRNAEDALLDLKTKYEIDVELNNFLLFTNPNCLPKTLSNLESGSITPAPLKHEALLWICEQYDIPRSKYEAVFKKTTSESQYLEAMEKALSICIKIAKEKK